MFKKIAAGAMSAVLCASALLSDSPIGSRRTSQVGEQAPAATQSDSSEGLSGSNSFAKYLQHQTEQKDPQPAGKNMQAAAAETVYSVTNLEFDAGTGLVRVVSSQTYAQKLVVSFIDEDNPANVYRLEQEVEPGEYIFTELNADRSRIPEFFTVTAQLVNRLGQPMCDEFTLKTYTHFVQEMQATDITEFEPEQVVNLDDSMDTNFFVLSEDTVQAESSEDVNTLVSADYDHNVYVFDHIDETVRSLKKGQFFYIRPTDEDIITTKILDIEIDGEQATVTGVDDVEDMFDVIKIEYSDDDIMSNDSAKHAAPEQEEDAAQYSEQHYNAARIAADDDKKKKEASSDSEFEIEIPLDQFFEPDYEDDAISFTFSHEFKSANEIVSGKLELKVSFRGELNIYKRDGKKDYVFMLETTAKATVTGTLTTPDKTLKLDVLNALKDEKCAGVEIDAEKNKVVIPLGATGLAAVASFTIELKPTLVGEAGITYKSTRGFHYYDGKADAIEVDGGIIDRKLNIKASAALIIKVKVGLSILGILEVGLEIPIKVEISAELEFVNKINTATNEPTENLSAFFLANYQQSGYSDEETVHACNACIKGKFQVTLSFKGYIKVGVFSFPREFFDVPIFETDWYYSITHNELGLGKCPHIAYQTTLKIDCRNRENDKPVALPAVREIVVDDEKQKINDEGETILFCTKKKNHTYTVNFDGHKVAGGAFSVDCEEKTIIIPVFVSVDEDGEIDYGKTTSTSNKHTETDVVIVTTAPVTPFVSEMTTGTIPKIPAYMEDQYAVQLGDAIWGHFYPTGYVWIHGHGDMYDYTTKRDPFYDRREDIRVVHITDDDPEHNSFVTSIGGSVFNDMTNLACVYLPGHITSIGAQAFKGCENLKYFRYGGEDDTSKTLVLPSLLTYIGEEAFCGCKSAAFGDLVIPDGVASIGERAFKDCEGIKTLAVNGNGETILGRDAFAACSKMEKAVIGEGVTGLNARIFNLCESLTDLTIPFFGPNISVTGGEHSDPEFHTIFGSAGVNKSDTMYKVSAFEALIPNVLESITVTGGESVPEGYFHDVKKVKHISLPETVTEIRKNAFKDCAELVTVNIPSAVTSIDYCAFYNCSKVRFDDLVFPEGIVLIGENAFDGCSGIRSIYVKGTGETVLDRDAFASCVNMKKAVIGKGVSVLNYRIFNLCESLSEVVIPFCGPTVDTEKPYFHGLFGDAADNHEEKMYIPKGANRSWVPKALKTVVITDSADVLQNYFRGIDTLESITLSAKLETVVESAFHDCVNLKEAFLIGEDSDWDNVEIQNTKDSNKPLVDLVRKGLPRVILADPKNQTVRPGWTARFAVYAASKYALTYLWQTSADGGKTWEEAGCTKDMLTFKAEASHDGNLYRCIVTDETGVEMITEAGKLTVKNPPVSSDDPGTGTNEKPEGYLPGDANGDGEVDVSDAVLLARYANEDKEANISDLGRLNGDVNGDGQTDMFDVTDIVMFIARRITKFKVEE